jgi:hypothetical protein
MGLFDGTAGWFANTVSDIGRSFNAPVLFNWDTNAARDDVMSGKGNRSNTSAAAVNISNQLNQQRGNTGFTNGGDRYMSIDGNGMGASGVLGASASYDPYAAYGGTAAYNNLRSGFNNQKNNIYSTALDAARASEGGYNQNILDTIRNLTQSQSAIDRQRVNNEAAKIQGTRDITDMVGRGIRSGGVNLASRNAGSSSAAQALANAYGELGQRELSKVGNQYAANEADIDLAQDDLSYQIANAPEKFRLGLEQNVNNIVAEARNQLSALDASMANASLPDRIALDQERQAIKDQVLGVLGKYNTQLSQGVKGIRAAGANDIRSRAGQQLSAGQAPANAFQYTTETPLQLQGTGPIASELPIFTYRNRTDI